MVDFKSSETKKNLMRAFAGESQARNKYTFFSSKAKKDGYAILRFDPAKHPMVLDLKQFRAATPRILKQYQLPADRSESLRKKK